MKENKRGSHLTRILLLVSIAALCVQSLAAPQAQNISWQLNQIKEKLTHTISEKEPEWKHSSITPMQGSENTIIDQWGWGEVVVKVSIIEYNSEAESTEALQRLATEGRGRVKPQHFGDEGYTWNERGSLAFRNGKLLVYVGSVSTNIDDRSVLTDVGDEAKATKKLAKYVADALADSK